METLAVPELTNMAPPKSEMSSDDITKDVGADDATIIIDWAQDDREVSGLSLASKPRRMPPDSQHPLNWSPIRKHVTVFTAVCTALIAAINVTSIALLNPVGRAYFGVTSESFTLGLTVNMVAIAIAPLFLAPLSEVVSCPVVSRTHWWRHLY